MRLIKIIKIYTQHCNEQIKKAKQRKLPRKHTTAISSGQERLPAAKHSWNFPRKPRKHHFTFPQTTSEAYPPIFAHFEPDHRIYKPVPSRLYGQAYVRQTSPRARFARGCSPAWVTHWLWWLLSGLPRR